MEMRADQVRAGHRIGGVRVMWARPLPDYTEVVIGLDPDAELLPGAHSDNTLWLRPAALVRVDDAPCQILVADPVAGRSYVQGRVLASTA